MKYEFIILKCQNADHLMHEFYAFESHVKSEFGQMYKYPHICVYGSKGESMSGSINGVSVDNQARNIFQLSADVVENINIPKSVSEELEGKILQNGVLFRMTKDDKKTPIPIELMDLRDFIGVLHSFGVEFHTEKLSSYSIYDEESDSTLLIIK